MGLSWGRRVLGVRCWTEQHPCPMGLGRTWPADFLVGLSCPLGVQAAGLISQEARHRAQGNSHLNPCHFLALCSWPVQSPRGENTGKTYKKKSKVWWLDSRGVCALVKRERGRAGLVLSSESLGGNSYVTVQFLSTCCMLPGRKTIHCGCADESGKESCIGVRGLVCRDRCEGSREGFCVVPVLDLQWNRHLEGEQHQSSG